MNALRELFVLAGGVGWPGAFAIAACAISAAAVAVAFIRAIWGGSP